MKNRKILCVDFDGTLCYNAYPDISKAKRAWIHKLILWYCKFLQKKGWYVILNTCRRDETLLDLAFFFADVNFFPNFANQNAPWLIKEFGDTRKISCDLNIDDKNFGLLGWILRLYERN